MPEVLVPLGMMAGAAMGEWLSNRRSGGEFSRLWSQGSEELDSRASSQRSSSDDESNDSSALREIPSCIRPGVFIGSVAAERDLNVLQALGITHVLQVGLSLRPRHWESLKYSLVKAPDSRSFDIFHAMIKCNACDFIEKGKRAGGVLVHCAAGRSRSAAVVCAYLMHKEGLECEEAIRDLCDTHWICPNVGFKEQLQLFEDLAGDIARWPNSTDPAWPKKVSRRSAMELDRPSMQEVRPVRTPSAVPCPEPLAKSASLPELAAPAQTTQLSAQTTQVSQLDQAPQPEPLAKSASLPELAAPAQTTQPLAETTQALQPDQASEPEPCMRRSISADDLQSQCSAKQAQSKQSSIIEEPVEVLDLYQDKPSRQEMPKKPEQKPEQANKWLAFQQLVSQQAAEEALQKKSAITTKKAGPSVRASPVARPGPQRAASPARSGSVPTRRPPAMCQTPMKPPSSNRRPRRARPQVPANSVFLPPAVWQQSDQGRDPNWSLRTALEAAGLNKTTQESALMTRRYSFDTSPPPAPALVKVI